MVYRVLLPIAGICGMLQMILSDHPCWLCRSICGSNQVCTELLSIDCTTYRASTVHSVHVPQSKCWTGAAGLKYVNDAGLHACCLWAVQYRRLSTDCRFLPYGG